MTHAFERAGLGIAPFRYVGMYESVYQACAGAPIQPAGMCDYCGAGIRYCCRIKSADGKEFIVGNDCVNRVNSDSNVAGAANAETARKKIQNARRRELAAARREEKRAAWLAARQAAEVAERAANNGKTLKEIDEENREARLLAERERFASENDWLIAILKKQNGDFCSSMARQLREHSLNSLSPKCIRILKDIYSREFGRRGSRANETARIDFEQKLQG